MEWKYICRSNDHGHSHHLPVIDEKHDFVLSSLKGLLIVLGLSVHELFEGLAIGLESSASYVWYVCFLINNEIEIKYNIKICNIVWIFKNLYFYLN